MRIPVAMWFGVQFALALAACGAEPGTPASTSSIVGTYRLNMEMTVEQAVEMGVVHQRAWREAQTDEGRETARSAFADEMRTEYVTMGDRGTLEICEDGTYLQRHAWPDQLRERPLPRTAHGRWLADGDTVTLLQTHVDGVSREEPNESRFRFCAGSLYATPELIESARTPKPWLESEPGDDPFIVLTAPVLSKD